MSKSAGIVIIGNEVLSGKTEDTNSHFLCQELRSLGVEVRRISVIPDETELIGKEVIAFSREFDLVFTTGGVGPTHDDVTMEGIALGFGVKVIRHPELEQHLRERHARGANAGTGARSALPRGGCGRPLRRLRSRRTTLHPGLQRLGGVDRPVDKQQHPRSAVALEERLRHPQEVAG